MAHAHPPPRRRHRGAPQRRVAFLPLAVVVLAATVAHHPAHGFAAVSDFNSAEVPEAARRWVFGAARRGNPQAQLALADYLYFAPRRFDYPDDDEGGEAAAKSGHNGLGQTDTGAFANAGADARGEAVLSGGGSGDDDDDTTSPRARRRRQAAQWYARAAAQGVPAAQGMLAGFYSMGLHGFPRDEARAVLYHTLAAAGGWADSRLALAHRHLHGIGVPRSCAAAADLYLAVADDVLRQADEDGEFLMFEHADVRRQVQRQGPKRSLSLGGLGALRRALPAALRELWDGWLRLQDSTDDVLEYYALQAEHGEAHAQFKLGLVQYYGASSLTRQPREAFSNFLRAAREEDHSADAGDDAAAAAAVAADWGMGRRAEDTDPPAAAGGTPSPAAAAPRRWTKREREREYHKKEKRRRERSAEREPKAVYMLGHAYLHGYGARQNLSRAYGLFSELSTTESAHALAASMLAYLDLYGLGNSGGSDNGGSGKGISGRANLPDYTSTVTNLFHAASHEQLDALYNLAVLHLVGIGVPQSYSTAAELFLQAAETGNHYLAMIRLGHMHRRGLAFRPSCATAVRYLKLATERAVFGAVMEEANRNYWEGDDARVEEALHMYLHLAEAGVDTAQANAAFLLAEQTGRTNPHSAGPAAAASGAGRGFAAQGGDGVATGGGKRSDSDSAPHNDAAGPTTTSSVGAGGDEDDDHHHGGGPGAAERSDGTDWAEWAALSRQATGWANAGAAAWLPGWLHWPPLAAALPRCGMLEQRMLQGAAAQQHAASVLALGDCHYADYVAYRRRALHIILAADTVGTAAATDDERGGDSGNIGARARARAEAAAALGQAKASAASAARQYFLTVRHGAGGSGGQQAELHGQALFNLAFLRFFGVALTADVKLIERYADALVASNPQAVWVVSPAVHAARLYFSAAALASDDWDSIAVAVAIVLLVAVVSLRYAASLDSASVLPFAFAHQTAVAAYALGVLTLLALLAAVLLQPLP